MPVYKLLGIFVFLLISKTSFAINHQDELALAQAMANSYGASYPILLMDRDEIQYLYSIHKVVGDSQDGLSKRLAVLGQYVEDKTSVKLDEKELEFLDTYVSDLPQVAIALPIEDYELDAAKICTVFVNQPNGNAQTEAERILQLTNKNIYPHEHFEQLTVNLSADEMYLFSLYHELGHCLDSSFLPNVSSTDDAHGVHLSEAFAETFAYLALVERLGIDIAKARAMYRILYSRINGEYFAQDFEGAIVDDYHLKAGTVYYLSPYLFYAFSQLKFKEIEVKNKNIFELLDMARRIVLQSEIDARSFAAIVLSLDDGFDKMIEQYEKWAFKDPQYFYKAYTDLLEYKNVTDVWVKKAFYSDILQSTDRPNVPELPFAKLCEAIKVEDKNMYFAILSKYREVINYGEYDIESVRHVRDQLNNLNKEMTARCFTLSSNQESPKITK